MNFDITDTTPVETVSLEQLLARINAPFPGDWLVICVVCNHLDYTHDYSVDDPCRCCRTRGGRAIPVRFEKRSTTRMSLRTGHHVLVRHPLAVEWPEDVESPAESGRA